MKKAFRSILHFSFTRPTRVFYSSQQSLHPGATELLSRTDAKKSVQKTANALYTTINIWDLKYEDPKVSNEKIVKFNLLLQQLNESGYFIDTKKCVNAFYELLIEKKAPTQQLIISCQQRVMNAYGLGDFLQAKDYCGKILSLVEELDKSTTSLEIQAMGFRYYAYYFLFSMFLKQNDIKSAEWLLLQMKNSSEQQIALLPYEACLNIWKGEIEKGLLLLEKAVNNVDPENDFDMYSRLQAMYIYCSMIAGKCSAEDVAENLLQLTQHGNTSVLLYNILLESLLLTSHLKVAEQLIDSLVDQYQRASVLNEGLPLILVKQAELYQLIPDKKVLIEPIYNEAINWSIDHKGNESPEMCEIYDSFVKFLKTQKGRENLVENFKNKSERMKKKFGLIHHENFHDTQLIFHLNSFWPRR